MTTLKTPEEVAEEACWTEDWDCTQRDIELVIKQDRATIAAVLKKRLEGIEEYMAVKDNDSHRYEIPRSKKEEWDAFCAIPEDDERSWGVPEWAVRIDGLPVRSYKDQAIAIIDEVLSNNK